MGKNEIVDKISEGSGTEIRLAQVSTTHHDCNDYFLELRLLLTKL